ncbi:MAG TPA: 30S ribosomal protein S3 [Alphaproteobacteria bacterium]|nr:30S ribosomal protein S3 [Alphaproteobacteria bacterium]
MIERKFVAENLKEFQIEEYLRTVLGKAGLSYIKMQRTPLGEKILICSSRPGLIVGKSGSNISKLTKDLRDKFQLENPQIELIEEENPMTDANIIAEGIANSLERFGTARFKGIGHKALTDVMNAGARGVEVLISGKIPSSRAKTWRFYMGYLKKSGDIAVSGVDTAYSSAKLKTGVVGVQVRIMPSTTKMPDDIIFIDKPQLQDTTTGKVETILTEAVEGASEGDKSTEKKGAKKKAAPKADGEKKPRKKAAPKKKEESSTSVETPKAQVEEILKEEVQ